MSRPVNFSFIRDNLKFTNLLIWFLSKVVELLFEIELINSIVLSRNDFSIVINFRLFRASWIGIFNNQCSHMSDRSKNKMILFWAFRDYFLNRPNIYLCVVSVY